MTDAPSNSESPLANRRVAFVGKLGGVNRKEARQIVHRLGGVMLDRIDETADWIVIGADVVPIGAPEVLLEDWISQRVDANQLAVIDETEFWRRLGVVDAESDDRQLYTPAMLSGLLDVPVSTIRRWQRKGLITPCRQVKRLPYFDFQEVALARRIAELIRSGNQPAAIERRLVELANRYPNLHRPLSQFSITVEGREVLLRQGEGLVEPNGQRRFSFDDATVTEEEVETLQFIVPAAVADTPSRSTTEVVSREDFLQLAFELEDDNELESAIEVYRSLMLAYGPSADLCFRVAELLYQTNDLRGARERYSMSIELEETFVEARANLGCVLVELGQRELARATFEGALKHHEAYADVHFHLARLLDDLGEEESATHHWDRFLELAPRSPWSAEARERTENQE